jgi:mRNA interferase MazF
MMFEAGELVLLPFPFSDLTITKRRPVLILRAPDEQGDLIACPVTSRAGWRHSRALLPENLADGTLPLVSWVRPDKIVTLSMELIARRFGCVTRDFRMLIAHDVCRLLHSSSAAAVPP